MNFLLIIIVKTPFYKSCVCVTVPVILWECTQLMPVIVILRVIIIILSNMGQVCELFSVHVELAPCIVLYTNVQHVPQTIAGSFWHGTLPCPFTLAVQW